MKLGDHFIERKTGLRPDMLYSENIFNINQVLEEHREYKKETKLLLVDYT